jgi:hypothetical protein
MMERRQGMQIVRARYGKLGAAVVATDHCARRQTCRVSSGSSMRADQGGHDRHVNPPRPVFASHTNWWRRVVIALFFWENC